MNLMTIIQGIASKKLFIAAIAIYLLSDIGTKVPDKAFVCACMITGISMFVIGCQTALDWKYGKDEESKNGTQQT
jgi:hypothetical protein